jgi:hypothetical protein
MTLSLRSTFCWSILASLASVQAGCEGGGMPAGPRGSDVDVGGDDDQPYDEYWCCDPDRIPCECPGLWHCTEGAEGKRCSQTHPAMPDEGGSGPWSCAYGEDTLTCTGVAGDHPDAGTDGGWECAEDGAGQIVCEKPAERGDFPDVGAGSGWECGYAADGEMRSCSDSSGGEGEGEGEGEWGDDWGGGEGEGEGEGADGEVCNGADDDRDGRVDEGRVCGDASEGGRACPTEGAIRICDAYCGVHQTCGPDGNWGPCTVDEECAGVAECDEHSDCARGFYCDYGYCSPGTFTFDPCESDDDCVGGFGFDGDWTCQRDQGVCIQDCYHHSDCGAGLVCDLGMCVVDPYVPGQC